MPDQFKSIFTGFSKAAGVELFIHPDSTYAINLLLLKVEKQTLLIESKHAGLASVKELEALLPKNIPVCLVVNGKGVLSKKVNPQTGNVLQQILPNAKADDFYFQETEAVQGAYLSIIRKDQVNAVLEEFQLSGYQVISLSLGAFVAAKLQVLTGEVEYISAAQNQLTFKQGKLSDYTSVQQEASQQSHLTIGKESLERQYISAYSAALQALLNLQEPIEVSSAIVQSNKEEFKHQQIFQKAGWSALIFFLILLLGNFTIFTLQSEKDKTLSSQTGYTQGMVKQLEKLEKETKEKENFLLGAGWMDVSKSSFYADRIAASIPSSVVLNELSVNPPDERLSKTERKQIFKDGQLVISGTCARPVDLNDWIKTLKLMDWIKDLKIENYRFEHKERVGYFDLWIDLK